MPLHFSIISCSLFNISFMYLNVLQTGKSKHHGFIEFEYPEVVLCYRLEVMLEFTTVFLNFAVLLLQVAKVVAECMHNYLLFEHMLQVRLISPEHVHPKL